jgi:protocatechuate 3,4-dioxygenase, alpha subunit
MSSASQTVGPFFSIGLEHLNRNDLAVPGISGTVVTIRGQILDGDRQPVPDAQLEFWQADALGNYSENKCEAAGQGLVKFTGFARVFTDVTGRFEFRTIKPGSVRGDGGEGQAPHIAVFVFMRGLLKPLYTRVYFPGEAANDSDAVLSLVPVDRKRTLIANDNEKKESLEWNVMLQGPDETVFFEW